ncbi:uncharacterized protein LOC143634998 isoform X1 [Bidens hawaiensis]|uniref:uncharacterized protein LOC143634998 isoform X1 n=1 Tax=Bidens hawaiensis TaxID=980011 RepID=UPI004049F824
MDYFRLCMLHFYMAVYMHELGMPQMAETFIREANRRARIIGAASGTSLYICFRSILKAVFTNCSLLTIHKCCSGVNMPPSFLANQWCDHWETVEWTQPESSAQARARARAWAQIQNDARHLAYPQGGLARSEYDINQARAREAYRLWQESVNDPLVSGNMSSQPVAGPARNDEPPPRLCLYSLYT